MTNLIMTVVVMLGTNVVWQTTNCTHLSRDAEYHIIHYTEDGRFKDTFFWTNHFKLIVTTNGVKGDAK